MIELLVPFRFGDDPARDAAWQYVRAWYVHHHRGYRITVGLCHPGEPWSKGRAVGRAFERTDGDLLVIADADVLVAPEVLNDCIRAVDAGAAWAQPHDRVLRLSEKMTQATYAKDALPAIVTLGNKALERRMHAAAPGGGLVVLSRDAYEAVGGIDPRFLGYGGDDISLARALDTLAGPCHRLSAPMWHLWHEPAPRHPGRRGSPENEALAAKYLDAAGDPDAMRALVAR